MTILPKARSCQVSSSYDPTSKISQLIREGLHIYMGGIGFQLFFILVFSFLAFQARRQMIQDSPASDRPNALLLLNIICAVLVLITVSLYTYPPISPPSSSQTHISETNTLTMNIKVRIVFRLIEYSNGYSHGIPVHEAYQYCLDSLPMFTALVLLNVVHPGRIMPGKESNLPSRKFRKAQGKDNVRGRAGGIPLYDSAPQSSRELYNSNKGADGQIKVEMGPISHTS